MSRRMREQLKNVGGYGSMTSFRINTLEGINDMSEKHVRIFLVLIIFLMALSSQALPIGQVNDVLTPPTGSSERKLILDALRSTMRNMHDLDMVFVVTYLKVRNNWAWIDTLPQSPDGKNRYEGVSALLRKRGTTWEVAEIACAEEDNNLCIGRPEYFSLLKKRFPHLPAEILPE
jgi:hypothetical protein